MIEEKQRRRKLGQLIQDPIERLYADKWMDSLTIIETNHIAAMRTRAAAGMYIFRKDMNITTKVNGNEIHIYKEKDFEGSNFTVDLR